MFQFIRIGLQVDRRDSTRAGQRRPLRPRRWRNHFLLGLERLENRTLLSTISWNNPSGGDWDTASNWSSNSVPGAGDDAVISIAVTNPITHSLSNSDEVRSLTSQDPINISGGTLAVDAASTVNNTLALSGGTLTGAGDLTVTTEFDLAGGFLSGAGKLILGPGAQMNVTGGGDSRLIDSTAAGAAVNWTGGDLTGINVQGPFNLVGGAAKTLTGTVNLSGPGTSVWGGTGALDMNSGAVFNNQAGSTIDVQSPLSILSEAPANGTTPVFTNAGTFRQTVTTGTTTFGTVTSYTPAVAFNNSGTVDVQTGTLSLQGGGTIAAGAAFTGAGFTRFAGGPGLQTMTINGAATGANLALDAGILTGPGDLTVSGEFDWTGGGLAGTGRLILAAGAQMNLTGASYTMTGGGRPVDSTAAGAAVNWTGGTLGGTLNVQGPFNLVGSAAKTLTGTVNLSGPGTSVWGGTGRWT